MPILKQRRERGYTIIPNDILESQELSLKDIGLLCYLLHLPEDWQFSIDGLVSILPFDRRAAIMASLNRLEKAHYLYREHERVEHGRFGKAIWIVSDSPMFDFPMLEKPTLENPTQQITNINNKEIDTITNEEKRVRVNLAPLESHANTDSPKTSFPSVDTMGGKPKMTAKRVKEIFGEELTREAVGVVTEYVDKLYPLYRGKPHPSITQSAKAEYAFRLLRLTAETCYEDLEFARELLTFAAQNERLYDPTIYIVTRPHALGHWMLEADMINYEYLRGTRYDFEEENNEDMPCDESLIRCLVQARQKTAVG